MNRSITAALALILAAGLGVAACGGGGSSGPGGAKNGAPAPAQPASDGLALSCQLGWDDGATDEQFTPIRPTGVTTPVEAVQVTAGNTTSALVSASAVDVNLYDTHGNLLSTVSVPLTTQGGASVQGVGPGNTVSGVTATNVTGVTSCQTAGAS